MYHKIFISIIIIFIGCTNPFAPKLVNENLLTSSFLTDLKSPKDVLTNFRYAYNFKDSLIYSEVLDSSFTFISINYSTTPITEINWGRDDDLRTTAKLFRHFKNINLTWSIQNGDSIDVTIDEKAELTVNFALTFDGGSTIPTLNGRAIFNFVKKKTGKWQIVRWEDNQSF